MAMKRLTRQRKAVLDVVQKARNHPDAAWIYQEVRKIVPSISLGTVYRTLEALVSEGQIAVLARAGEATRYDANPVPHHHLICERCGEIVDLEVELPELLAPARAAYPELTIHEAKVEFRGLCPACRQTLRS
ncbi:manganese-dependent transcriptional regulator PerR [Oceanithermus desulfurans]|uniref:Transcriptional repressor n=2 Tax=Oceanithermus desulfurans TaxID=227924 RepID=A0A511RG05_9DEIN|nr:transcriptional repressor [Oceanithermus desulfurans]MBB6030909.1 Fe2+ or Zn2+ uptake regulation protein [Oceanithermus desulfurans]GEM88581.1 transcriptional repressor [Oceanithermus desulfurans NBRC 100063]